MELLPEYYNTIKEKFKGGEIRKSFYYPTEKERFIHTYRWSENYKLVLDGEQKGYYENGDPSYIYQYDQDVVHGEQKTYCQNGNINVYQYKQGVLHGCQKEYNKDEKDIKETYYFYGMICTFDELNSIASILNIEYNSLIDYSEKIDYKKINNTDIEYYYNPSDSLTRFIFVLIDINKLDLAKILIKSISDLNCDKIEKEHIYGDNLLIYAIEKDIQDFELITLLINKGFKLNQYIKLGKKLIFYLIDKHPNELKSCINNEWDMILGYEEEIIIKLFKHSIINIENTYTTYPFTSCLTNYNIVKKLGFKYDLSLDERIEYMLFYLDDNVIKQILSDNDPSDIKKVIGFIINYKSKDNSMDLDEKIEMITKIVSWFPIKEDN